MKKLLTIIATMIMCNAYGEDVYWVVKHTLQSARTTCTSSNNITIPTTPQRTGYRFIGWVEGTTDDLWDILPNSRTNSATDKTFSATFPYGTVSGISQCSITTFGSNNFPCSAYPSTTCTNTSSISSTAGAYCWCKLTSIQIYDSYPIKSQIISVSAAKWRPISRYYSGSDCVTDCSKSCEYALVDTAQRKHMLKGN